MKFFTQHMTALLLAVVLVLGVCPVFASAKTAATEISSLEEITDLAGSYILTADTTVTAPVAGTFTGVFDGNGKTITVNITATTDYTGIFSRIGEGGEVKNFKIADSAVTSTGSYTGLVAGNCAGAISDVIVENSTVEGYNYIGGLVGTVLEGGAVSNCAVESGTVSRTTAESSDHGIGGLVGENNGSITASSNGAKVTNGAGTSGYFAGIAGRNYGTVSNCYNAGEISNTAVKMYRAAGVVAQNNGTVENCHNVGTVGTNATLSTGIAYNQTWGAVGTVSNAYYLSTCGASGTAGTSKTADEFLTLAVALGSSWTDGDDGYPVLKWQDWKYTETDPDPDPDPDPVDPTSAEYTVAHFIETTTLGQYEFLQSETLEGTVDTEVSAEPITVEGFTFNAENSTASGTVAADGTLELKLYYSRTRYNVNWDANGGTVDPELWTGSEVGDVEAGAVYGLAFNKYQSRWGVFTRNFPEPENGTMVFDGWYTEPEGGEKLHGSTIVTIPADGSFTFYAHWLESCTVTLDPGEGKLSNNVFYVAKGEAFGTAVSTMPQASQYTYYHFNEWVNGEEVLTLDTIIDEDKTYYATWNPNYAIVKFDANGGEGTMEDQYITYGNDQPLSKNTFTREGFTFVGWNTSSTATEALYADQAMGVTDPTYNGRTYRLYAIWAEGVEKFDLYGANMKLGNDLSMNFFVSMANVTGEGWYAEIARGDDVLTIDLADCETSGDYYKITYPGFAAKEMTDEVVVTIYDADGNAVSNPWTDSIRTYAMRILGNEAATDADKTLMVDMLNYGAAAQSQFIYKTNDLANALLNDEQKAYATESVELTNKLEAGENYYGSSLNLKTNIQMNVYFTNVTEDMTATVTYTNHNGETKNFEVPVVMSGSYGKVTVESMVVADAYELLTIEVKGADGNVVASVIDSVESYCQRTMGDQPLNEYLMKFAYSAWKSFED